MRNLRDFQPPTRPVALQPTIVELFQAMSMLRNECHFLVTPLGGFEPVALLDVRCRAEAKKRRLSEPAIRLAYRVSCHDTARDWSSSLEAAGWHSSCLALLVIQAVRIHDLANIGLFQGEGVAENVVGSPVICRAIDQPLSKASPEKLFSYPLPVSQEQYLCHYMCQGTGRKGQVHNRRFHLSQLVSMQVAQIAKIIHQEEWGTLVVWVACPGTLKMHILLRGTCQARSVMIVQSQTAAYHVKSMTPPLRFEWRLSSVKSPNEGDACNRKTRGAS